LQAERRKYQEENIGWQHIEREHLGYFNKRGTSSSLLKRLPRGDYLGTRNIEVEDKSKHGHASLVHPKSSLATSINLA
jgi:hypothetical protein